MTDKNLSYPIGKFNPLQRINDEKVLQWINDIAALPQQITAAVHGLTDQQLDTPYRPGGWTVRQVVHHLADSHMNAYIRIKLALTEEQPTIRPYEEKDWAELPDTKTAPIENSLELLRTLHLRWVQVLQNMTPSDMQRTYYHPADDMVVPLQKAIGMYAWHGKHHLAHILLVRG